MPLYEFDCPQCGKFETMKAMEHREYARCPHCNSRAPQVPSVVNHTFGFRLTEASHERFSKDEYERDV